MAYMGEHLDLSRMATVSGTSGLWGRSTSSSDGRKRGHDELDDDLLGKRKKVVKGVALPVFVHDGTYPFNLWIEDSLAVLESHQLANLVVLGPDQSPLDNPRNYFSTATPEMRKMRVNAAETTALVALKSAVRRAAQDLQEFSSETTGQTWSTEKQDKYYALASKHRRAGTEFVESQLEADYEYYVSRAKLLLSALFFALDGEVALVDEIKALKKEWEAQQTKMNGEQHDFQSLLEITYSNSSSGFGSVQMTPVRTALPYPPHLAWIHLQSKLLEDKEDMAAGLLLQLRNMKPAGGEALRAYYKRYARLVGLLFRVGAPVSDQFQRLLFLQAIKEAFISTLFVEQLMFYESSRKGRGTFADLWDFMLSYIQRNGEVFVSTAAGVSANLAQVPPVPTCTHCHRVNPTHPPERCFSNRASPLYRGPPAGGGRPHGAGAQSSPVRANWVQGAPGGGSPGGRPVQRCYRCGGLGHTISVCPSVLPPIVAAGVANGAGGRGSGFAGVPGRGAGAGRGGGTGARPGLGRQQVHHVELQMPPAEESAQHVQQADMSDEQTVEWLAGGPSQFDMYYGFESGIPRPVQSGYDYEEEE
jgi:hypothetical protein